MPSRKTKLAVLFADVSGSTRLYEAIGDTGAFGQVRECLELLKNVSGAFGGRVVKTIGDGAMCVFPTADAAAQAAREMQLRISQWPGEGKAKLMIRVGFHFGLVIQEGDDVFGDSVNVAARMSGLAGAGQVITTGDTVAGLSLPLREVTRRLDALPVKGKLEGVDVHELLWQTSSDRTVIPGRTVPSSPSGGPWIKLIHHGKELTFKDIVYFGREAAGNNVVIADPMTSRRHAKIELRAGKFVLVDQSANGTFVTLGGEELKLRREEMILHGAGRIAFGHSAKEPGCEIVEFRCDKTI